MYRDMPMMPDSFCSVHSRVTCRRTSFFFEAATTTRAPREVEDFEDGDLTVVNAEVDAIEARAAMVENDIVDADVDVKLNKNDKWI
jgi:hypothetical protein